MTKIHLNDRIDNYFDDYRDELMNENARIALVISSRKAQSSKELNIVKGEYLEVSRDCWIKNETGILILYSMVPKWFYIANILLNN